MIRQVTSSPWTISQAGSIRSQYSGQMQGSSKDDVPGDFARRPRRPDRSRRPQLLIRQGRNGALGRL
jgi:hypothetical protein